MKTKAWPGILVLAGALCLPAAASARGLSVELWTDRGSDAVYQPGDPIQIKARTSDDAYLLVYEIDAEGAVHVLFPFRGENPQIPGRNTLRLPGDEHGEMVVDATTGEGYIVAIASATPFEELPWYLRPYDPQGEAVGYVGKPDDEEGITEDGRIVGDPFVAMERIRRRVLRDARDGDAFATAYTSYYVHERVRYPRYICNDCHRPGRYAWWNGFDPYYTTCPVFDFRVNWSWGWGPRYWYGSVPYFVYVYRDDCPPAYRRYSGSGIWYSSWDGWDRWRNLWGNGGLHRYKSPPPAGYVPPDHYWAGGREARPLPPGFIANNNEKRGGLRQGLGFGAGNENRGDERGGGIRERRSDGSGRDSRSGPGIGNVPTPPAWRTNRGDRTSTPAEPPRLGRARDEGNRGDARPQERERTPRIEYRPREEYRVPDRPREERAPTPRQEYRAPDPPRQEARQPERRAPDPPRQERRDDGGGRRGNDDGGNRGRRDR